MPPRHLRLARLRPAQQCLLSPPIITLSSSNLPRILIYLFIKTGFDPKRMLHRRYSNSMAAGRFVSGQCGCDACMKNKSIIDNCSLCILVIVDNKIIQGHLIVFCHVR